MGIFYHFFCDLVESVELFLIFSHILCNLGGAGGAFGQIKNLAEAAVPPDSAGGAGGALNLDLVYGGAVYRHRRRYSGTAPTRGDFANSTSPTSTAERVVREASEGISDFVKTTIALA